jgi:hypothetical protein
MRADADWHALSVDDGDLQMSPLRRIVWMGESGVNEERLNGVLAELASLATAAHGSRMTVVGAGFPSEVYAAENDAEDAIRLQINNLTRILVDVLRVENKQHKETFDFRLGQCVRASMLQELWIIARNIQGSLQNDGLIQHPEILRDGKKSLQEWQKTALAPVYRDIRQEILGDAATYNVEMSAFLRDQIANDQLVDLARINQSAEVTLGHIDSAAGKVGAKSLAKGFAEQRDKEARRARWWTGGVVASISSGIGLPALILTTEHIVFTELDGTTGSVIKALAGIPLFALAAYCGRVSSQHRETERHLGILATQIDAVQAFADQLPDSDRPKLLMNLGNRAFADPGLSSLDHGNVGVGSAELLQVVNKALDLGKSAAKGGEQP